MDFNDIVITKMLNIITNNNKDFIEYIKTHYSLFDVFFIVNFYLFINRTRDLSATTIHSSFTGSRPISEVNLELAHVVLGWGTTWE